MEDSFKENMTVVTSRSMEDECWQTISERFYPLPCLGRKEESYELVPLERPADDIVMGRGKRIKCNPRGTDEFRDCCAVGIPSQRGKSPESSG